MTSVFSVRRRAEEFHTLVEGTSTGSSRDARLADCLDLVAMMRDLTPVEPAPGFTATLREQLMDAADTLLLPSPDTQRLTLPSRRTARDRRIAAVVGGFAIIGASTSLAVAASTALPGEMLYPLKRALENAETGVHLSDEGKGVSLLANATDRLAEVSALSRTGDLGESVMIADTLATFSDQALQASDLLLDDYAETGDEGSIEELRNFTSTSMQTLTQLEALLPEEAQDELVYAAQVLGDIDAAAAQACPSCAGGITQIPAALMSAGHVTERPVVVVPAPLVQAGSATGSGKQDQAGGTKGDPDDSTDDGDPLTGPTLSPDTDTGTDTGTGEDDATNPIDALTDPVTGQGDGNTSNGGGTLPGVPEVDDVTDGVDDGLPELP